MKASLLGGLGSGQALGGLLSDPYSSQAMAAQRRQHIEGLKKTLNRTWLDNFVVTTAGTAETIAWDIAEGETKPKSKMPLRMELQHETDEWLKDAL